MQYDKEIFKVLREAGDDGLSIRKITRHVFNASNSLFDVVDIRDVHRYVSAFMKRNSCNPDSFVCKTDVRGTYRLNMKSKAVRQLMLEFKDPETEAEEETVKSQTDQSLSLF